MLFQLEVVSEYGEHRNLGLRSLKQPDFYPVCHKEGAYLLGHDLLEHFDFMDYSYAAEVFATGAMAHVRGEEYFNLIRHQSLNGQSLQRILTEDLSGSMMGILDGFSDGETPPHFDSELTLWNKRAKRARNAGVIDFLEEQVVLLKKRDRDSLIVMLKDSYSEKEAVRKSDLIVERTVDFAYLGYLSAKKKYAKCSEEQLPRLYKTITRVTEQMLDVLKSDLFAEGDVLNLRLNIEDNTAQIRARDPYLNRLLDSETGGICAQYH